MITKIQSFTDVITNSSSTVFVMSEFNAEYYNNLENTDGCISITPITIEWLRENPEEVDMVCHFLNINPSEVTTKDKKWGIWNTPDKEFWDSFLELHKDQIEKVFKDLYWVDIEDHFENAWDITEEASHDAEWSDYRH